MYYYISKYNNPIVPSLIELLIKAKHFVNLIEIRQKILQISLHVCNFNSECTKSAQYQLVLFFHI